MSELISKLDFLKTINLLISEPHLVNKKICGSEIYWIGIKQAPCDDIMGWINTTVHNCNNVSKQHQKTNDIIAYLIKNNFQKAETNDCNKIESNSKVIIKYVLPKIEKNKILEIVIIDEINNAVHIIAEKNSLILPELSYSVLWKDQFISIEIWKDQPENEFSSKWLNNHLFPCIVKWAKQMKDTKSFSKTVSSLQLVNVQRYNEVYQQLKTKYAQHLIEIWTECTDPQKYIFEDIAIASYLLTLWEQERTTLNVERKQTFVDLGCGNGLLVFLLSMEGHKGKGIDIRSRKIWNQFPDHVELLEESIEPSDAHLYPDFDWLIGNHSDELTPWIPVIAAKSGLNCRFFVIPCCAYDFNGKFQRRKGGMSGYAEYLDYVSQLGSVCGFHVQKDKLRIPSTKRICFVGQNRTFESTEWPRVKRDIFHFIKSKCDGRNNVSSKEDLKENKNLWCEHFVTREAVQKVKNCTQLDDEVKNMFVTVIVDLLLEQSNFITIDQGGLSKQWNKGGSVRMSDLVSILRPQLRKLKSECGGLQTLLKNHRNIFLLENGNVYLRVPESCEDHKVSSQKLKSKKCWFFYNHPQGCVQPEQECTYSHC